VITRIEAANYRCFEQISVGLSEFCILAGANGSGKTTLLDIPVLLGDILRSRHMVTAFTERIWGRGARVSSLNEITYRSQGGCFLLGIEARLPEHLAFIFAGSSSFSHIRYEIQMVKEEDEQLVVSSEGLFVFSPDARDEKRGIVGERGEKEERGKRWILKREPSRGESAKVLFCPEIGDVREREAEIDRTVAAFPRLQYESRAEYQASRWFLDRLLGGVVFFEPTWSELRKASPPGLPKELMPMGENLPWLALQLQKQDPERFAAWNDHLRMALPQLSSLCVREREEDHHAYFRMEYEGGFEVTSSGLSEGTLRILALTLLAYLKEAPWLLVIEEPENSIHPRAIEAIMQSLRSLYDRQVWVSTHSPVVLAGARLEELLITRLERQGVARVVAGREHPRLSQWKGAIDLGSLFATGVFE
jgi:predicted ATPase